MEYIGNVFLSLNDFIGRHFKFKLVFQSTIDNLKDSKTKFETIFKEELHFNDNLIRREDELAVASRELFDKSKKWTAFVKLTNFSGEFLRILDKNEDPEDDKPFTVINTTEANDFEQYKKRINIMKDNNETPYIFLNDESSDKKSKKFC